MVAQFRKRSRGSAVIITLIIVVIVAIISAIVYVVLSKSRESGGTRNIFSKTITATTPDEIKALLTDAKAGKYDAKCTYTTTTTEEDASESTIYIGGAKKMRVHTPINKQPRHLVRVDDVAYVWADGDNKGSKLPMADESETGTYTPNTLSSKAQEYHMKCNSVGDLDDSLFALPKDVTFTDFNAEYKSSASYGN